MEITINKKVGKEKMYKFVDKVLRQIQNDFWLFFCSTVIAFILCLMYSFIEDSLFIGFVVVFILLLMMCTVIVGVVQGR